MARSDDKDSDEEIIAEAKKRFERCVAWEASARANAEKDARFADGDAYNNGQWEQKILTARAGRPCLTYNKVRQHNLQIVNDARQHKTQIKVTPTGGRATYEAAKVLSGIVRRIEYQSKAVDAYSTAIFHQVYTGIGYCRVVTEYLEDSVTDQEIYIRRIPDPKTVYLDPDAKDYDKADMRFAFVFNDIARDVYEAEHGEGDMPAGAAFDNSGGWNDKDHIREAEYWRRSDDQDTLHLMSDGTTLRESELPEGGMEAIKPYIQKSREFTSPRVEWFKIVGDRIDDRKDWPGRYIPIVPFIGEETVIDGIMDRKGHTRALIGAQQMFNYWSSQAVEQVSGQTKNPWIVDLKAVEGLEKYWDNANIENRPYLPYNSMDDAGQQVAKPERINPPEMAQAFIQGMSIARDDMLMVSGQYQATMGAPSNEVSGTAIQQRQRMGENATAHFIDNQAKGIRQIGRIVLDLTPKIYDTARVTKIMAEDGSDSDVHLVPNAPDAHQHVMMTPQGPQPVTPQQADAADADPNQPNATIIFNPNVGKYDVEADVGPSYGTQRQEAANAFSQIMANNPQAFAVVGDFWAQNSDFPGADDLADRLRKGLPAQYKAGAPDPQVVQLQQAMQQQGQQAHALLGKADAEIAQLKQQLAQLQIGAKDRTQETTTRDYEAETRRLQAVAAADPAAAQVIIRSMLSSLLGMPALPIMHEHQAADAEHEQAIAPPPQQPVNGAGNGAAAP
jgi:hypothetical protein